MSSLPLRRRCSSKQFVLLLFVLACLCGCGGTGDFVFTIWGPIDTGDGPDDVNYIWGGDIEVTAFAHQPVVTSADGSSRDFLEVVLVSAAQPVTCDAYTEYLSAIQSVESYIDEVESATTETVPTTADWHEYVCQYTHGAALRTFGGSSSYRAVHTLVLVDAANPGAAPASGLFGPRQTVSPDLEGSSTRFFGADAFAELSGAAVQDPMWTYVTRTYERSHHGEGILPTTEEDALWMQEDPDPITWCGSLLTQFDVEVDEPANVYPDVAAKALQAATHRYYHQYTTQPGMNVGNNGEEEPIGLTLPGWSEVSTAGGELALTVIGKASRAPSGMPFANIGVTTRSDRISVQPCPGLSPYVRTVWPELL